MGFRSAANLCALMHAQVFSAPVSQEVRWCAAAHAVAAGQEPRAGGRQAAAAEAPAPAVQKRLSDAEKERWRMVDRMLAHILGKARRCGPV